MSTNHHPTDEDLILHFYGEGAPDEARRLDEHLGACAPCRQLWVELGETMTLVDRASVPEPGPGFERVMWAKVQAALPTRRRAPWAVRVLLPMAATVVISALTGGYLWRALHPGQSTARALPTAPSAAAAPGAAVPESAGNTTASATASRGRAALGERVLLTALDDHFQQTQTLLIELKNAPDDDAGDFAFERATADDLISSGRLYRVMARQNGDTQMAQMLEDLESVLLDVARSRGQVDADDMKALRARIESQDLLFKVRSATKQVHERQRDLLTAANSNE
jgi:hypothetical protein